MDSRGDLKAVTTSSSSDRTVCRNWLEGNCPETDDTCTTGIHQYDLSRMTMCPSIERNEICTTGPEQCIYRHRSPVECIMYKLGFCPNGPGCFFTHVKKDGPPPSVTDVLEIARQAGILPAEPQHENTLPAQQSASVQADILPAEPQHENALPAQQSASVEDDGAP